MVALVLVSHSRKLAESVRDIVVQMTSPDFPVAVASGAGENHDELGTDAVHIADVLQSMNRSDGVLVLMDLGSAVLSAQSALELLESTNGGTIRLCAAPLVEGAVAAAVQAFIGGTLEQVAQEAQRGLAAKHQQLQPEETKPPAPPQEASGASGPSAEIVLIVNNQHGLHARPAALLVQTAGKFSSAIQVFNMTGHRGPADARSLTSVALLQVRQNDRIRVVATGGDSQQALQAISDLAAQGFGESTSSTISQASPAATAPAEAARAPEGNGSRGRPGSDGIAIGPLLFLEDSLRPLDETPAAEAEAEFAKLRAALNDVADQLRSQTEPTAGAGPATVILQAQSLILSDPVLLATVKASLDQKKISASRAWREATDELAAQYRAMNDPYLRERAADVCDIARTVLRKLNGNRGRPSLQLESPAILFTGELLPSEAAACDPEQVLGVITREGSATSHSTIILRTLGIPMVVGVSWTGDATKSGATVAMDGATGEVWIEPDQRTTDSLAQKQQIARQRHAEAVAARSQPATTLDGTRVEILANASSVAEASAAQANAAEGIGLLRTEFLFLSRNQPPTEQEQANALREIFACMRGPIITRTLDAGADKPLPFLAQPIEHNPFLGMRGIRLSLKYPEFFVSHLRAILAAGVGHDLWIMFPMVSALAEVVQARTLLERAHRELAQTGNTHAWPVKLGAMIEVPAAALISEQLAQELDFFSIGTNDLTQYVMAAERGNSSLAELEDPLHPAVLRLMKTIVQGAASRKCHVSVCGDAPSDPVAAAVFVGLGIRSLSVRPAEIPAIKAAFRKLRLWEVERLVGDAVRCADAQHVRELMRSGLRL